MRIKEFEKICGFRPKFSYWGLDFPSQLFIRIENTELLNLVKKVANLAYPDEKTQYERKWFNFYLPVRAGEAVAIRVCIINYKKMYAFVIQNKTPIEVFSGKKEVDEFYFELVREIYRFSLALKKHPEIIKKCVPPSFRTGKVLGRYVMERVLDKKEKERRLKDYQEYRKTLKPVYPISLNQYLNVCAICYRAAFGEKTKGMSPEEMYRRWADGRDCGMLEIKKKDSKRAFSYWLERKSHCGGHPFEIVFSWHEHGIHLYPPSKEEPWFKLRVTNYAYAWDYLKMVEALMKNRIPFEALRIEEVLKFLAGETYFRVNEYSEHFIFYSPELWKDIRKYIEWDPLELPKWR